MKKLATVSLFIFGVVVTAILVAGLLIYQNKKDNQKVNSQTGNLVQNTINNITSTGKNITLDMTEISKHNKQTDCWMLINGKVYDITSYFGSHPGGNANMLATCGKDATDAYKTQDPYATSSGSRTAHSSRARNLLDNYYIGDFNQTIISNKKTTSSATNSTNVSKTDTQVAEGATTIPNNQPITTSGSITLSTAEIAKHNKQTDCWYLISGKVYNITSFFGSHPGGNSIMVSSCGKDATAAYNTKDPNATSSGSRSAHSSNAVALLNNYYIGDLNQTIGQQKVTETNTVVAPVTRGDDDGEYDD
ncbi:MAG TPA: cytochrome b5 domain-containing protein [Candidatus Paceibacterota bacterium]|nr:cytochrome b5 domain-containing protein [Candidatus Paceibacterota bacterium]